MKLLKLFLTKLVVINVLAQNFTKFQTSFSFHHASNRLSGSASGYLGSKNRYLFIHELLANDSINFNYQQLRLTTKEDISFVSYLREVCHKNLNTTFSRYNFQQTSDPSADCFLIKYDSEGKYCESLARKEEAMVSREDDIVIADRLMFVILLININRTVFLLNVAAFVELKTEEKYFMEAFDMVLERYAAPNEANVSLHVYYLQRNFPGVQDKEKFHMKACGFPKLYKNQEDFFYSSFTVFLITFALHMLLVVFAVVMHIRYQ